MITEIKLTPRRMTLLSEMGINNLNDLVNYYPKKYDDLSVTPLTLDNDDKRVVCIARIYSEVKNQRLRNKLHPRQIISKSLIFHFTIDSCYTHHSFIIIFQIQRGYT